MALIGYEWLIVVGILLVVFLWGPQKLPELARSIGLAKKEFDKVKSEATSTAATATATTTSGSAPTSETADALITAAKSLGISTEGKTKEQIAKEIAEKASK